MNASSDNRNAVLREIEKILEKEGVVNYPPSCHLISQYRFTHVTHHKVLKLDHIFFYKYYADIYLHY